MAQLPANRTKLQAAITNQQPSIIASAQANREAMVEAYDTIDQLYNFTSGLVAGGTLQPYPQGINRQAIINGNFDVWKRGTISSYSAGFSFVYKDADRWRIFYTADFGISSITQGRQQLVPGDIPNAYWFYRLTAASASTATLSTSAFFLEQAIENGTSLLCGNGKKLTLSFWARSSVSGKKLGFHVEQRYGSGGSPTTAEIIGNSNFTLSNTWQKYTVTFATNALSGKIFGSNNDDLLLCRFSPAWGSNYNASFNASSAEGFSSAGDVDIDQIQINAGDAALPFQPRTVGEEELQSKRFCHVITGSGTNVAIAGNGFAATTTVAFINVRLPDMRIPPSLVATPSEWGLDDGATTTALTSLTIQSTRDGKNEVVLRAVVASGLVANRPYQLLSNITTAKMVFDAEL